MDIFGFGAPFEYVVWSQASSRCYQSSVRVPCDSIWGPKQLEPQDSGAPDKGPMDPSGFRQAASKSATESCKMP